MIILFSSSIASFSPTSCITSWYFPDIYVHTNHCYLISGQTQCQPCFPSCLYCKNALIINYCCSNESISNISFINLINDIYLAHIDIILQVDTVWTILVWLWWWLYHQKRKNGFFSEVFHMTVNNHYLFHQYCHDSWWFDLIQMMLYYFHLQRHMEHCCVGFVYKHQNKVVWWQ